jgi:hypothetical protein
VPNGTPCGGVAEWLKAADCKSARIAYAGSNPAPSTTLRPAGFGWQATRSAHPGRRGALRSLGVGGLRSTCPHPVFIPPCGLRVASHPQRAPGAKRCPPKPWRRRAALDVSSSSFYLALRASGGKPPAARTRGEAVPSEALAQEGCVEQLLQSLPPIARFYKKHPLVVARS